MANMKHLSVVAGIFVCSFMASTAVHANTTETTVSGEIMSGDFSMTTPNDVSFNAKLTGKTQKIDLDSIKTTVTDYRGSQQGWQVTVSSPNYSDYADNYQLNINGNQISNQDTAVYKVDKQILVKKFELPVMMEISAKAVAGSYSANLVWNLQPNIKEGLKE